MEGVVELRLQEKVAHTDWQRENYHLKPSRSHELFLRVTWGILWPDAKYGNKMHIQDAKDLNAPWKALKSTTVCM